MSAARLKERLAPLHPRRQPFFFLLLCFLCTTILALGLIIAYATVMGSFSVGLLVILAALLLLTLLFLWAYYRHYLRIWHPLQTRLNSLQELSADPEANDPTFVAQALLSIIDRYEEAYQNEYTAQLLQKQAELDSLQSQINPHFLYNTLESIRGQAIEDGSFQTAEMIEVLSKLFRYTISQHGDLFSLDQELRSLDNYLRIQQYRFDNRFHVLKAYDEHNMKLLSYKIPKLSLQPIVENALYHGLENLTKHGVIEIGITTSQSRLIIYIEDNGIGMSPEAVHAMNEKLRSYTYKAETRSTGTKHSGIAVTNVNARLKLLYGQEYGITLFSTQGMGTRVELTMPLLEEV